jgi:hypothetical protein
MKSTHNTIRAYGKGAVATLAMVAGTVVLMAACSSAKPLPRTYDQSRLPVNIQVPAGHEVVLETRTAGLLNYECRANVPTAGTLGWALVSPQAELLDRAGKTVANYSGPPPTWVHIDGSSVVGSQLEIAPVIGGTNLPLQLSKGTSGPTLGVLSNVSYIQRINTKGGEDFSRACIQADIGKKMTLPYQADYIFWKPL